MRKDETMNEEMKNAMEALGVDAVGAPANPADDGEIDWKAKYEEAQRQLASARVDAGRVRKLDGELKVAQSKIAELEKATALGSLPAELQDVPDSVKETALLLSQKAVEGVSGRMEQLEKSVEEEKAKRLAQMSNVFVARINQNFPWFAKGLKEGGALKAAWDQYQVPNAASINEAFATLNYDVLAYHINRFCETYGVDPSGGRDLNAAPDPRTMGGGVGAQPTVGGKKTYTPDEWESEFDDLQNQYEGGVIGPKDYEAKRQILLDAYKEGRVKPRQ